MEILDKPKVIVGGAGAWQIDKTGSIKRLGVDCVINGRAEAVVLDLFQKAEAGLTVSELFSLWTGPILLGSFRNATTHAR